MTPKLWLKMAGSALLVLILGLVVRRAANAAGHGIGAVFQDHIVTVHTDANASIPIALGNMSFFMKDVDLGHVQSLMVGRRDAADVDSLIFKVKLNEGVSSERFQNCEVTLVDPTVINSKSRFTCLTAVDPGFDALRRFGSVIFYDAEGHRQQTHRLMLPESMVDSWHAAAQNAVSQSGAADRIASRGSDDHLEVMVGGKKLVEIDGGKNGGSVVITDPSTGAKLVDIQGSDADGSGRVVIRDPATGKNILEISGSDAGGTVKVNGVTKVQGSVKVDAAPPAPTAPVAPKPAKGKP